MCRGSGGGVILQCASTKPCRVGAGGGEVKGGGKDSCSDKQKGAPQWGDKSVHGQSRSALKEFLKLQRGTTQAEEEVRFRRKG